MAALNSLDAYGSKFQIKVINALLKNNEFTSTIRDILDYNMFPNQAHQWIIKKIIEYFEKFNVIPTIDFFSVETKKIENEILKISIIEQLKDAYRTDNDDKEYVQEEFLNFCRNQCVKKAIMNSIDLLQAGDYDSIRKLISDAVKAGEPRDIGHEYEKDIEIRYRDDDRHPIPFPWKVFNDITQGGCGQGDLIILFGSPKGGKSWVAVAMAVFAAMLGYNVVYYTLELSANYVGKRMDSNLSKIPVDKVKFHRDEIDKLVAGLKGKIIIKEYSPKRASLTTIENHLDKLESTNGFKPDMVFIDYLDLLKNRNSSRKEIRDDLDDIYTDARGVARDRKIPIISPSQVNRAGAKDEIIEGDKIAGSYSKYMIADILISLSRQRKDKIAGTGKFYFMGNRYGKDGVTFGSKINLSNGDIEVFDEELDIDDPAPTPVKYNHPANFDADDKKDLREKYFELFTGQTKV